MKTSADAVNQFGTQQLDLFQYVTSAYGSSPTGRIDNQELYRAVSKHAGIKNGEMESRVSVGRAQQPHNLLKRKLRWHQQTLKHMGLIERVEGERGLWQLTDEGEKNSDARSRRLPCWPSPPILVSRSGGAMHASSPTWTCLSCWPSPHRHTLCVNRVRMAILQNLSM